MRVTPSLSEIWGGGKLGPMPSSTTSVSTAQLLVAGAGTRSNPRRVKINMVGAVSVEFGDESSQDYQMDTGDREVFYLPLGDDLWADSTGAASEVEAHWTE